MLVEGPGRILHVVFAHGGAQAEQGDALLGIGAAARDLRVDVEQSLPIGNDAGQPFQLGQKRGARWLVRQGLAQHHEGARRRAQALLAQGRDLEGHLDLIARFGRAGAFAQVDADEVFPQRVGLRGAFQLAEA